ncbi:hypothetical protein GLOTRDRAFT_141530 [Gloeophyllum trabeum ATCC 11539]|uniref:Uncharacterized protein n=1 Tax=Gloeophyllum trabeum (strain ATCC 11539 / FP-39264 / Madison 617) TaxID=670483 RepID=S7RDE7_GLOTA|nr:uncharacterized protein GLOTRDRAFT_141530 [Gloeophyllum trabeum ATCC 11539]EPQ50449.1 hypothetical protein GLOTRDRAFT_141530 [Gloeophyllum trabeum ATCC 11539]
MTVKSTHLFSAALVLSTLPFASCRTTCYYNGYRYVCRRRGLLGGAIAGIVVGIIAFVLICLLLCLLMLRRRRRLRNNTAYVPPAGPAPPMSTYPSGPGYGAGYQPPHGTNGPMMGRDNAAVPPQNPPPPQYTKHDPPAGIPPQNGADGHQNQYQPPAGPPPAAPAPTHGRNGRQKDNFDFIGGFRADGRENV